jgi:hypothetical protein
VFEEAVLPWEPKERVVDKLMLLKIK